jgi:hypothetical protein
MCDASFLATAEASVFSGRLLRFFASLRSLSSHHMKAAAWWLVLIRKHGLGKQSDKTPLNWAIWAQNIDEFRLGHSTRLY